MRARVAGILLATLLLGVLPAPAFAGTGTSAGPGRAAPEDPWWSKRIDALIAGRAVSVAVGNDGTFWYRSGARVPRAPASNEKLLLSMALFSALGPDATVSTRAMTARSPTDGVVDGDLWLVGRGDPEVGPDRLNALADEVVSAGITRIRGSVVGSPGPFGRDWWAAGWRRNFPEDEVAIPTALTFRGNVGPGGAHVSDPELRAAAYLTKALRRRGVAVGGKPGVGTPRGRRVVVASVESAPLSDIVRRMDVNSINLDAEVLGKLLGAETSGRASIAGGAAAIDAYTAKAGAPGFTPYDASGLSYDDRVTAQGMVRLLWVADRQTWAEALRLALPIGGQGTLEGRLGGVRVRAKTGTLHGVSALSGWVWSKRAGSWIEFSILDAGMTKSQAVRIEDAIVRLVAAAPPT